MWEVFDIQKYCHAHFNWKNENAAFTVDLQMSEYDQELS